MAKALQALLASLCFGRIHVVGYSLGARVALELCTHTGPPASLALALLSPQEGVRDIMMTAQCHCHPACPYHADTCGQRIGALCECA